MTHVIVETVLAQACESAVATLHELRPDGLDRHEAVHAMRTAMLAVM